MMSQSNDGRARMPSDITQPKNSLEPIWLDSSYLHLPEFLDKLTRWIKRHPKYCMLWTQARTLFPNGIIALDSPLAITSMRARNNLAPLLTDIDLAQPCMGTPAAATPATFAAATASAPAPTLTALEEKEYRIAPAYIWTVDLEAEQAILGMIVDLQRQQAVAELSRGSGRRAAQVLAEWASTRISNAQLDNVLSLQEQHVTKGIIAPTHDAFSEWKTKFDQLSQYGV